MLRSSGRADVQGAAGALVVGRDRDEAHDPVDLVLAEPVLAQVVARLGRDEPLRARAGVHALGGDAHDPPARGPVGHGDADQPVHLLGGDVGDRGALLHRVAGVDRDLAAQRPLALHDPLGDVLRQHLDPEGLADHHLVDRLVDRLLEARHVDALLVRPEVAEAGDIRVEQPLVAVVADPDRLRRPGDPGAGEADGCRRTRPLEVLRDAAPGRAHPDARLSSILPSLRDCDVPGWPGPPVSAPV